MIEKCPKCNSHNEVLHNYESTNYETGDDLIIDTAYKCNNCKIVRFIIGDFTHSEVIFESSDFQYSAPISDQEIQLKEKLNEANINNNDTVFS